MDDKGRPQARSARFVGVPAENRSGPLVPVLAVLAATLFASFGVYVANVHRSQPNSTINASVYKIFFARDALRKDAVFQCEPSKRSCSHMTSCEEAFFHQERCGVSEMDGDRDGIPCERQWCN
jgi:hypothetical protein